MKYALNISQISKIEKTLLSGLDETQRQLFTEFTKLNNEIISETEFEKFTQGFKIGVKLTVEGLC